MKTLNQKINWNKAKHLFVENELKKYKYFIQLILEKEVILKKMIHKVI